MMPYDEFDLEDFDIDDERLADEWARLADECREGMLV